MSQWITQVRIPLTSLPADQRLHPPVAGEPWAPYDLELNDGILTALHPAGTHSAEKGEILWEGKNRLLLPGFADAHVHLDKAHSWDRAPNLSGTFEEAIQVLSDDKVNWTEEDVYRRAAYSLRCAEAYGTTAIRTHLDTEPGKSEPSYRALKALKKEWQGRMEIQYVSLCMIESYASPLGEKIADLVQSHGGTGLGGMPVMHPELDQHLDALFRIAKERKLPVDLHVDESGNPEAQTLKAVAQAVLRHEFPHRVTCGHCCSLSVLSPEDKAETLRLVREAGIQIISLPLCNQYLQGRLRQADGSPATPQWRGLTLLHELHSRGLGVAAASDNVRDGFYAYGDFDMREVWLTTVRLGHLDLRPDLSLDMVTRLPADFMECPEKGRFAPGLKLEGTLFDCRSFSEIWSRSQIGRSLVRGNQLIQPKLEPYLS
jgi:cytosine deaminase